MYYSYLLLGIIMQPKATVKRHVCLTRLSGDNTGMVDARTTPVRRPQAIQEFVY